jgi:RNA polymerase sigma-70 factor (ECF subfamily)
MNPPTNEHVDIAGYLMEMLTPEEKQQADEHLSRCPECRAEVDSMQSWADALREVPEEMLLDGPPDDADLLLQRTLRQVRKESSAKRFRRTAILASAAAAVIVVAIGGGVIVGRSTAPTGTVAEPPVASVAAGARTGAAVDPATGARMTVTVTPAAGWVRVNATVVGIPPGEKCRVEVVATDGTTVLAGSWLASSTAETKPVTLNGSALIDPAQVQAVRVVSTTGEQYVKVDV